MYENLKMRWVGDAPLLLHSDKLADPRNPFTKAMKNVSKKRTKTDEDFELMSELEWAGGLHTTEPIGFSIDGYSVELKDGGKVHIPGEMIEATLISAAKKRKLGTDFKSAIFVQESPLLSFPDSDLSIQALWDSEKYIDTRKVRIQKNAVMRTRPIFPVWAIEFTVTYYSDVIENVETIAEVSNIAGKIIGIGDYRPRYGRFSVELIG